MIQFGNDKIKEIYYVSDKIKEVYHGADLVWKAKGEEAPFEHYIRFMPEFIPAMEQHLIDLGSSIPLEHLYLIFEQENGFYPHVDDYWDFSFSKQLGILNSVAYPNSVSYRQAPQAAAYITEIKTNATVEVVYISGIERDTNGNAVEIHNTNLVKVDASKSSSLYDFIVQGYYGIMDYENPQLSILNQTTLESIALPNRIVNGISLQLFLSNHDVEIILQETLTSDGGILFMDVSFMFENPDHKKIIFKVPQGRTQYYQDLIDTGKIDMQANYEIVEV